MKQRHSRKWPTTPDYRVNMPIAINWEIISDLKSAKNALNADIAQHSSGIHWCITSLCFTLQNWILQVPKFAVGREYLDQYKIEPSVIYMCSHSWHLVKKSQIPNPSEVFLALPATFSTAYSKTACLVFRLHRRSKEFRIFYL